MEKCMKEFKKWFNKEIDAGRDIYPSSYDDCEDAWKAALTEVRNNNKSYDIIDAINEELEG